MTKLAAIIALVSFTFLPGLELRASLPVGFFTGDIRSALGLAGVIATCFVCNVIVGMIMFEVMALAENVFRKWGWFDRKIWPLLEARREKLRPSVEKYGAWGVAIFIGIPLPLTGAYTGAIGAYLLKLERRRFWLANLVGVLIAAVAVTAVCVLIQQGAIAEGSPLRKLFLKEM